tara:strand:+ start:527 stop:1039 length:513 start_codon:yes stop_codon:yes gene_type:complete
MKNLITTLFLFIFISTSAMSAGTGSSSSSGGSSGGDGSVKSNYQQAVNLIKHAKKYEKKGKTDKAEKRYKKALKFLTKANKKKPNDPDTLNYLGFTTRKLGDFENGEKYYLAGLKIEPNHIGINEYLGELYVATNRIDLAKERLNVLSSCNCKEYSQLKEVIEGTRKSKY